MGWWFLTVMGYNFGLFYGYRLIIFSLKKRKSRHADAQLKAGGTFIYNRNGRFHTTDRLFV